jgi:putative heme-binding domain-containing protein
MRRCCLPLLVVFFFLPPQAAPAWGPEGHIVVARIAELNLSDTAREQVKKLLDGHSIATKSNANWADYIKRAAKYRDRYPDNDRYHYVSIPIDAGKYEPEKQCKDDKCVIAQIERFRKVLADVKADETDRKEALLFLIHLVGDMHQPLHCAERHNDRGGNLYPARYLGKSETNLNLHKVWDFNLVQEVLDGLEPFDKAQRANQQITAEQKHAWQQGSVADWAAESCRLARDVVYKDVPDDQRNATPPFNLDEPYVKRGKPVVEEQLRKAGIRLACVLNDALAAAEAPVIAHGLRVPAGFEVTEYADSKLANDIFCLTIDPRGRVVVSGPGYLRLLIDDKNEGKATRAVEVFDGLRQGAQGMLWEGDTLYYSADGGVQRRKIVNDKAGPPELVRALKTGGEHDIHALRRGPDGWLYLMCGNISGVTAKFATLPSSPIKEPVAGAVVRFSPDLKQSEIVADGFRNPYDMDFNLDGELFTFDSDNERCVSLPWYEPTRSYHVIPGGHYGWQAPQRAQSWRMPPYFLDVVPPLMPLGRGSPTGVTCYRHVQFPEAYRGGFFLCDWTFGRVYFMTLKRSGSSYVCEKQLFLQATGDEGFAPTAAAVHPETGDLFISIGGRGTRGAVYRIRHTAGFRALDKNKQALAALRIAPRSLDWQPGLLKDLVDQAKGDDVPRRLRALIEMRRQRAQFNGAALQDVARHNLDHADRHVRRAAADLLGTLTPGERWKLAEGLETVRQVVAYCQASYAAEPSYVIARAGHWLNMKDAPVTDRVDCVRLLQLSLGDLMSDKVKGSIWEGYTPRRAEIDKDQAADVLKALRSAFPTGHADLDREISRTLAMLEDGDAATLVKVANKLTAMSSPIEDVHYLTVLARLRAPRNATITQRTATALLALDVKLTKEHANRESHWPMRVGEMLTELVRKDEHLSAALIGDTEFGRPDHALFAHGPGFDRRRAAEMFLARAAKDAEYPWNATLVELLGELPREQALPALRRLWGQAGLDESIVPLLARQPEATDRERFLAGLNSPQVSTVRICLEALDKLPGEVKEGTQLVPLVQALRRLGDTKEEKPLRELVGKYLRRVTGQEQLGDDPKRWAEWFTKTYPQLAARLSGPDAVDVAAWEKRLAKIDWSAGDAERGKLLFTRASCASCHSGAQALGPDLRGVANRFSRDDLLTAILQPSKDISPRYRTTQIATAEGKLYQGLVIYEAVDSLILQTGPATTVRVVNTQIASKRLTDVSLMPAGLLDMLKDGEIADLLAYLKSLSAIPAK